jgi:hypothetical protein
MLHLALVGNILRAVGEAPQLYDDNAIPTYPNKILVSQIPMDLEAAVRESFAKFVMVLLFLQFTFAWY